MEISKVIAHQIETGEKLGFSAPLFAGCAGDGMIGFFAGADFDMGCESKAEFCETTAPEKADKMTRGHPYRRLERMANGALSQIPFFISRPNQDSPNQTIPISWFLALDLI